ncbi:MAG: hypothetical protein NT106_14580 [Candidatus Sumerlaeota bacterium]|nr:hypothetical protein [Candidatus Sumerlaeota bacterium]
MRRIAIVIGVAAMAISMFGCATMVYERQTELKIDRFSRTWDYSSADFEVLGPVEASGESQIILGLLAQGTEGYGLLMKAARQKYGQDVSTVMFIFSDYQYQGILYPIFGTIKTTYSGAAVKAKTISHTANVRVKQ